MLGFLQPRFPVIKLNRSNIVYGWVQLGKHPSWQEVGRADASAQNYQTILTAVKKKLSINGFFLLLADDICYTSTVEIPLDTNYTRSYVFDEYIHSHIPEDVEPASWDYKLTQNVTSQHREALVVVPVQHIWQSFIKACATAKLTIIATEPVSLATQRHQDPYVGIALKPDLSGKDKDVLNIPASSSWTDWLPFGTIVLIATLVGWLAIVFCIAWLIFLVFGPA